MPTNGPPPKDRGPQPVSPPPPPPTKPMRAVGITEGRCKGGQNPPLDPDAPRPPAPQGSGGQQGLACDRATAIEQRLDAIERRLSELESR